MSGNHAAVRAAENEGNQVTKFSGVDVKGVRYTRDREPQECPICHYSVQPVELNWSLAEGEDRPNVLEIVFACPRRECHHLFIARYKPHSEITSRSAAGTRMIYSFRLYESVPATPAPDTVPPEVATLSPSFVEIYSQASAAEAYSLQQVAGAGYRKALEFLVKDYSISLKPSDEASIRSSTLSACIRQYIDSPQARVCAERATWLGNDETHYERRWESMDLKNLKDLIVLTVNWIHSSLLTRKYETDMPS